MITRRDSTCRKPFTWPRRQPSSSSSRWKHSTVTVVLLTFQVVTLSLTAVRIVGWQLKPIVVDARFLVVGGGARRQHAVRFAAKRRKPARDARLLRL